MKELMNEILARSGETLLEEKANKNDLIRMKNELKEYSFKVKALYEEGIKLVRELSDYRTPSSSFAFKKRDDVAKAVVKLENISLTLREAAMPSNISRNANKLNPNGEKRL